MCLCKTCSGNGQERCPFNKNEIPVVIQKYGCAKYIKQPKPYNIAGEKSKCVQCRYLFRKPRGEMRDKSFIVCGAIPSISKRTQPVMNCPYFKPLRKKQLAKRFYKHNNGKNNMSGRDRHVNNGYVPNRGNRPQQGGYQRRPGGYNR